MVCACEQSMTPRPIDDAHCSVHIVKAELLRQLILTASDKDLVINARDFNGRTPLHLVCIVDRVCVLCTTTAYGRVDARLLLLRLQFMEPKSA